MLVDGIHEVLNLSKKSKSAAISSHEHLILNAIGDGGFVTHTFDGLQIEILKGLFYDDLKFENQVHLDILELSILIEGEKIIRIYNSGENIIQENQEVFMSFSNGINGVTTYCKGSKIHEIKIRMYYEFIKKHQIIELFSLFDSSTNLEGANSFFSNIFSEKCHEIVTEILADTKEGLLKRLFLEAKVLELIALQFDISTLPLNNSKKIIKKLQDVKNIINSNLNHQFSILELSNKVLLNHTILGKEFKRIFNTTIAKYTIEKRMSKAKALSALAHKLGRCVYFMLKNKQVFDEKRLLRG